MPSRYPLFDRSALRLEPLSERRHDLDVSVVKPLAPSPEVHPGLAAVAEAVTAAVARNACVIMMMGAHVVRSGVQRFVIDLMRRGLLTCLAGNGAVLIHDYELALIGATTENVARYIKEGRFGLWRETGALNDIAVRAAAEGLGLGEAVGRHIAQGDFPHKDTSLLAAAWRYGVPFTAHVCLGQDIVHEHPNCDGAAIGAASYRDFLIYAKCLESLEGGVVMSFGSSVMAPEVYLKALAMVRNVAHGQGREIRRFTTLVTDLLDLPGDASREPARDDPRYYFRPWKTMLARTTADGGQSHYVCARHDQSVPQLWTALSRGQGPRT